jgi:hypothetical protein
MHMRKQILGRGAPYVEVRSAAISVGLDPGGSECRALVDELLRDGCIRPYPSPSLTAHGLYRLTDSGISAADEADRAPLRYGRVSEGHTEALVAQADREVTARWEKSAGSAPTRWPKN